MTWTWRDQAWEHAVTTISWIVVLAAFGLVISYVGIEALRARRARKDSCSSS